MNLENADFVWSTLVNFCIEHAGLLVTASLLTALLTLALVPILITNIPADYFICEKPMKISKYHPIINLLLKAAKNLLGAVFLCVGFILLFLPGQGLVMILAGLLIMNYPGKYAIERWLILKLGVLPAMNTLRIRYGKPPLISPTL
nr:PGPGW domain-containing protein [uncultured Glaciecola sp.]